MPCSLNNQTVMSSGNDSMLQFLPMGHSICVLHLPGPGSQKEKWGSKFENPKFKFGKNQNKKNKTIRKRKKKSNASPEDHRNKIL